MLSRDNLPRGNVSHFFPAAPCLEFPAFRMPLGFPGHSNNTAKVIQGVLMAAKIMRPLAALCCVMPAAHAGAAAGVETGVQLDEVSITATREVRATKDVPQSITVIGQERIENSKMNNIKDAIEGTPGVLIESKNGGYDARLIIRGAGLKAAYGVREIMVLRDGVPLTDPDSMTRLDWVDTQDIERIEISKGPGNLFSPGIAGGAIQIISKSAFAENANRIRVGVGDWGGENLHLRLGTAVGTDQAVALTYSKRSADNSWRQWNKFESEQASFKHGLQLAGGGTWESELAYTSAKLQLPGSMSAAQFETFKQTGRQTDTQDAWKHSGRNSESWLFNTKLEQEYGDWTFKPRFYFNQWRHYHPVTGLINDTRDWTTNIGTDLEAQHRHQWSGVKGSLSFGLSLRRQANDDTRKYQYRDVTLRGGRITATRSDAEGLLAEVQRYSNTMSGIFAQESLQIGPRLLVDLGLRFDRYNLDVDRNTYREYNYSGGNYSACVNSATKQCSATTKKSFNLPSPKLGLSYKLDNAISAYLSLAQASQVPSDSETTSNNALNAARVRNVEVGLKGRAADWNFDAALYRTRVQDEIVSYTRNSQTIYENAGRTDKKGFEFSGGHRFARYYEAGINYAYSDYRFVDYVDSNGADLSGKRLNYVPRHQYGVYGSFRLPSGWRGRLQLNSWGQYFIDNANTETYSGYSWVANASLAYETGPHTLALNVDNLFDKHYASQVSKDAGGTKVSYSAAAPRSAMATYTYRF